MTVGGVGCLAGLARGRVYTYITAVLRVKDTKPFSKLVSLLEDSKPLIQLVDYSEENRRVVVRCPAREVGRLESIAREYAAVMTYEVKATLRAKVNAKTLKGLGAAYRPGKPGTLLFYLPCNDHAVYGESKGREVLLKLCRKAAAVDPAALPPGLCTFDMSEHNIVDVVEKAEKCFNSISEKLAAVQGEPRKR